MSATSHRTVKVHRHPPRHQGWEKNRHLRLSVACALAWIAATFLSGIVGIWFAVGSVALALGVAAALIEPEALKAELRCDRRKVALGLAGAVVMVGATYALFPLARWLAPSVVTQSASLYATFGGATGAKVWIMLPLVVIGEELVWRGVVQRGLLLYLSPVWATLAAAGIYSLSVLAVGSWLLIGIAIGCGLYWSALRTWSRSLVPVLIAHLVWDLCVFILFPLK